MGQSYRLANGSLPQSIGKVEWNILAGGASFLADLFQPSKDFSNLVFACSQLVQVGDQFTSLSKSVQGQQIVPFASLGKKSIYVEESGSLIKGY